MPTKKSSTVVGPPNDDTADTTDTVNANWLVSALNRLAPRGARDPLVSSNQSVDLLFGKNEERRRSARDDGDLHRTAQERGDESEEIARAKAHPTALRASTIDDQLA